MGLSLENAVGNELEMWNGKGKIVGITDDFHNDNLKFGIEPMIFMYSENIGAHYFIKLGGELPITTNISKLREYSRSTIPITRLNIFSWMRFSTRVPDRIRHWKTIFKFYRHCYYYFMFRTIWLGFLHYGEKNQRVGNPKGDGCLRWKSVAYAL